MKYIKLLFHALGDTRVKLYIQASLLLLAVIMLYAGSLSAPFVFDDFNFFSNSGNLSKYDHGYFSLELRWLPYASLAWTVDWLGFDRSWLRLGNVLLHAANGIALFFLLRRVFQVTLAGDEVNTLTPADSHVSGEGQSTPTGLTWFAFFGALIFALHPIAVYGIAYLIQRSTLMATLFMLLMLLAYLEGLLRGSWRWMLAAALCYFAAVYSKEHSIAAPGVALALTMLIRKPSAALLRQIAPFYVIATLIAAAVVWSTISSKGVLGEAYETRALGMLEQGAKLQGLTDLPNLQLLSILTQCGLFFKYLGLWLLPNPAWMSVDMREPFAASLLGWNTLGVVGFLGYFCGAVWLLLKRGRVGLLGFALLFPWILFLTEWSTVRIQEPFVLYRSYLWMPGLFFTLPIVFGRLAPPRAYIMLGLASVLLVPLTLNRLDTFSSALKLWDDAEKLVRGKTGLFGIERIYYNRGTEFGQLTRYQEAIADFSKAIATYPFDYVYGNRATAYYLLGRYDEALLDYDRAIALNPENANSFYNRALVYRAIGDFAAAQEDIRKSCALGLCP
jgi:protein O-mannosyl-transferase